MAGFIFIGEPKADLLEVAGRVVEPCGEEIPMAGMLVVQPENTTPKGRLPLSFRKEASVRLEL